MSHFVDSLNEFLLTNQREPDGKLHLSSDMTDNLRHSQLGYVNAPTRDENLMSLIRMNTGTLWHEWLDKMWHTQEDRANVLTEVKLDNWMHDRWSGTCDMLLRYHEENEWTLWDYKVVNPMSLPWVQRSGGKSDHKWQVSGYYYAAEKMIAEEYGEVLSPYLNVVYLPAFTDNKVTEPFIATFQPIDREVFFTEQAARTQLCEGYAAKYADNLSYLNDVLVEPDLYEHKERKGKVVRLPHWRSKFCPYEGKTEGGAPLCGCHLLKQKTLGPVEQWGHLLEVT